MGIFDSTKTRVIPLMEHIGLDHEKMNMLFKCFEKESPQFEKDSIDESCYGTNEKKIRASKEMLNWMLQNLGSLKVVSDYGTTNQESETYKKRKLLFSGDLSVLNEAITLVTDINSKTTNKWYIFEGKTSPDIYITTKNSVFIGEAKRTEKNITTKTQWLDDRDQLVRHIDSLLDQEKAIYSFYILERSNFNKDYQNSMKKYEDKKYFSSNLKHRSPEKIERAFNSFLGFLFWEDLAEQFKIHFPEKV